LEVKHEKEGLKAKAKGKESDPARQEEKVDEKDNQKARAKAQEEYCHRVHPAVLRGLVSGGLEKEKESQHHQHHQQQQVQLRVGLRRHFLFNLLSGFPDIDDKDAMYIEDEKEKWRCEKLREFEIFQAESKYRRLRFLLPVPKHVEIFVDAGTLKSEILRRAVHGYGIEVSLPEYDLREREDRFSLLQWLEEERPAHVFMAPPCTTWSKMQRRNKR
jgi:hypothetical protein